MPKLTVITRKVPFLFSGVHANGRSRHAPLNQLTDWLLDNSFFCCIADHQAYGGAYDVMSSKHLRGDVNYAWFAPHSCLMFLCLCSS